MIVTVEDPRITNAKNIAAQFGIMIRYKRNFFITVIEAKDLASVEKKGNRRIAVCWFFSK